MSLAQRIGLPDAFQTSLLVLALLLVLAPYFAGLTVGGVQLPRLDRRRRRALKVAGPIAVIATLALVLPIAALAPPPTRLELVAADVTDAGEVDLVIANSGSGNALLTRIDLEVLVDRGAVVRPVLASSARYRIAIGDLSPGHRRGMVIRQLIPPRAIERILVDPGTNRSMRMRITIHAAGGVILTRDLELWPGR